MNLQSAINIKVAAALIIFLGVIALNYPKIGIPLVIGYAVFILWMMYRQRQQS